MPSSVDRQQESGNPDAGNDSKSAKKTDADVGNALRAVYRDAIDEDVPDEMLDLLNKLG